MRKYTFLLWLVLVFIGGFSASCSPGANEPVNTTVPTLTVPETGKTIVLGDISDDPAEVIEGTQPLADYLAAQLGEFGIISGEVRIAGSMEEMINLLKNGEVDICFDSVYPATLMSDATGGQIFIRRWRYGVETYHSVIFASKESGIQAIQELPGHLIVFDTPYSTSGFVMPAVYLLENGISLVGKRTYNDSAAQNEVGFVFSYDDENTLQWVLRGFVAAGATDDYNFDIAFPPEAREKFVVLARTEEVPRQVGLAKPGIDPELLNAIVIILKQASENEAGQAVLEPFQTTRFDDFPEGILEASERMREMMDKVKDIQTP